MFGPMGKAMGAMAPGMGMGAPAGSASGLKDVLMQRMGGMGQKPPMQGMPGGNMASAHVMPEMPGGNMAPQKQMPSMSGIGAGIGAMTGGNMGRGTAPMAGMGIASMMGKMRGMPQNLPQQSQRFDMANRMADGYRNGWNPNPMMTRLFGRG